MRAGILPVNLRTQNIEFYIRLVTLSFSDRTVRAAPLCGTARSRRAGGWYVAWIGAYSTSPRARLTRAPCGCMRASQLDDSTHEHRERLRRRLFSLRSSQSHRAPSRAPPSRAPRAGSARARPLSDRRTCACADLAPRIVAHRAIHRFAVFTLPCEVRCSHALMALHVPSCLSALRLCARKARLRRLCQTLASFWWLRLCVAPRGEIRHARRVGDLTSEGVFL